MTLLIILTVLSVLALGAALASVIAHDPPRQAPRSHEAELFEPPWAA